MATCKKQKLSTAREDEEDSESDGALHLSEEDLHHVSQQLSTDWRNLGRKMGIPEPKLECIEVDNNAYGMEEMAYRMLLTWNRKAGGATVGELQQYLNEIGRKDIATNLSAGFTVDPSSSQDGRRRKRSHLPDRKCKEWMENLKENLKTEYQNLEMKGLPWIKDLELTLDEYYVDLSLVKVDRKGQAQLSAHITVNDIFNADGKVASPSRILVEGGPGLGKSTFAAKLAYDWAKGETYIKHFELVFFIPLRHFQGKLEDIISEVASIDGKDKKHLLQILKDKTTQILILMDGYDEVSENLKPEILPVLLKKKYSHTTIVLTSRPGKLFNIASEAHKATFRAKADIATNLFHVIYKLISIKGFNAEQQQKFINIHTQDFTDQEKRDAASKLNQMVDEEFLKCPLFLLLLIVVLSENSDTNILPTSRTDLYKHVFNCIMRRYYHKLSDPSVPLPDMDLFSMNDRFSASEKPSYIELMLQFSEFSLWSIRKNKLVFSAEDITKTCKRDPKLLEIGILTQSVTIAKMRRKLSYEPVHRSLLEFGAAYGLWMDCKQPSIDKDLCEKVISVTPYKEDKSVVCLSFLLGLMGDQAGAILKILLPYKSCYKSILDSFENFLPCLSEIQITPSVLQSLSPFLPPRWKNKWAHDVKESGLCEKYEEIVCCGLQERSIEKIIWSTPHEVCIPPKTEVEILTFEVYKPLTADYIQEIVQKYRKTKLKCKSFCVVFLLFAANMPLIKKLLPIIEHEHLTLEFLSINEPVFKEFIKEETLYGKTLHRVDLNSVKVDQPSLEIIDKMMKSKIVEQLVISAYECNLEDQESFDILCSSLAKVTHLRGFTFLNNDRASFLKVDLANLFDGDRESWDVLQLAGVTVECTKQIEKQLSINYLGLIGADMSESAAQLLGHCNISSVSCSAALQHRYLRSLHISEVLSELNLVFDETIEQGISPMLTQFCNLEVLALRMSDGCSLRVSFEDWLFGSNTFVSLRGLEIWDVGWNAALATVLVKGVSGCLTQSPEITNCKQKLQLQYLRVMYLTQCDLTEKACLDIISDLKLPLKNGDLPRLDVMHEHHGIPPRKLCKLFPVEEGFQIDCGLRGADDPIYSQWLTERRPERYSIAFSTSYEDW